MGALGLNAAVALLVTVLVVTGLAHWTYLLAASILQVGLSSFMMPALLSDHPGDRRGEEPDERPRPDYWPG